MPRDFHAVMENSNNRQQIIRDCVDKQMPAASAWFRHVQSPNAGRDLIAGFAPRGLSGREFIDRV
jgi:hypothetical protein